MHRPEILALELRTAIPPPPTVRNIAACASCAVLWLACAPLAQAALVPLPLNPATAAATNSQTNFSVGEAVDGIIVPQALDQNGWAIYPNVSDQTAVFETTIDFQFTYGAELTFMLHQIFGGQHTIGRFRLSVTSDDRSLFANGMASGGDVTANWTVLDPLTIDSMSGATLTVLSDSSILASGTSLSGDLYTVTAWTSLTNITGIRLEVLDDPSLPSTGPGRQGNGNFVLSEIQVFAIPSAPEPGTLLMWAGLGLAVGGGALKRRWAARRSDGTSPTWPGRLCQPIPPHFDG